MAAQKVEELKNTGNKYVTSKPPQYEKAIEMYTEALSITPTHHTILSNRSLAYYKLGKYEDALADAEKAIFLSPNWAKGYLRKCAALNMLKRSRDAQAVAEKGFQLMHSTTLCRDFVLQWLKACEDLYSIEKLPSFLASGEAKLCQVMISHWVRFRKEANVDATISFLPNGLVVLSEQYWRVLFYCLASRTSPLLAITHELMSQHLNSVAKEFERIVGLFGQRMGAAGGEWVEAIAKQIDSATLDQMSTTASQKSSQLISFLSSDLHEVLYPLARSLLALAVTVVTTRVYTLNSASTGFYSICYMLQACLSLFEHSILNTREYIGLHLKVLSGLVDSYNRRYKPLSLGDCADLTQHCKMIESLLPTYASSCRWEYQQMGKAYEHIVATAKGLLLARQTGSAIPFQGLLDKPQETSIASALRDVETNPAQIKSYAVKQLQDLLHKPPPMVSIADGQDLVKLTGVFLKLDDFDSAKKALTTGEKILLSLVGVQLQQGILALEEAPSTIGTLRQDVLMNAVLLKNMDAKLVTDMMIRWKSLYSEFRTVAMRKGLGKAFLSTTATLHSLQTSGTIQKYGSSNVTISMTEEHKKKEIEFLKQHAFQCWSTVVECPRLLPIEKILEEDELVVEFIQVGKYDEAKLRAFLEMYVLTIMPNGERELVSIDSTKCNQRVKEWLQQWNNYTNEGIHSSSPEEVKSLQVAGERLSAILFPTLVQQKIRQPTVKHVYLGLDVYCTLPIHLLPGQDGRLLFADCTISYVNACRELIREYVMSVLAPEKTDLCSKDDSIAQKSATEIVPALEQRENYCSDSPQSTPHLHTDEVQHDSEHQDLSSGAYKGSAQPSEQCVIPTQDCYIFADPNYDLVLPEPNSGNTLLLKRVLDLLVQALSLSEIPRCESLPSSLAEAHIIRKILENSHLKVNIKSGNSATLDSVFQLNSPLLVHFSTHAFGQSSFGVSPPNFLDDTKSGLILAGFNTYRAQKFDYIDPKASTGILTPLATFGLNLTNTRLVFLSTCVSAVGTSVLLESANSLANAFRVAGALTVVATIWKIPDEPTTQFVRYFYNALLRPGVRPSEALAVARVELCKDSHFSHLQNWAGFACFGDDIPLFPNSYT